MCHKFRGVQNKYKYCDFTCVLQFYFLEGKMSSKRSWCLRSDATAKISYCWIYDPIKSLIKSLV